MRNPRFDIFTGTFTVKWRATASRVMTGTLYGAYYDLPPESQWTARAVSAVQHGRETAAADPELLSAAGQLMRLLDARGAAAGKYNVTVSGSSGVQVGDNSTQVNHFGEISVGRDVYHAGRDMTVNPR